MPAIQRAVSPGGSVRTVSRPSRPSRRAATRPARSRTARCLTTATRLTGSSPASVVAVPSPRSARRVSTRQRVGAASAALTSSATALIGCSDGDARGVVGQVGQLDAPALAVALGALVLLGGVDEELVEAALDHAQAGAVALGLQRELDERRVALDGLAAVRLGQGGPAIA